MSSETDQVSVPLKPRADQVQVARQRVADLCSGMDGERTQVVKLLVSELVTRALQRHPRALRLIARRSPQEVRVDVREEDPPASPEPLPTSNAQLPPSMAILARLASTWGVKLSARRRTVWFTLRTTSRSPQVGVAKPPAA